MKMPDRIWAWSFHKSAVIDEMQGGWTDKPDKREVEYTRSDLVVGEWNAALKAAAALCGKMAYDKNLDGEWDKMEAAADLRDAILALLKGADHE